MALHCLSAGDEITVYKHSVSLSLSLTKTLSVFIPDGHLIVKLFFCWNEQESSVCLLDFIIFLLFSLQCLSSSAPIGYAERPIRMVAVTAVDGSRTQL